MALNSKENSKENFKPFILPGFKIEIMSNLKIVNFLDISFNLSENVFKPFHKAKQTPFQQ